MLKYSRVLAAIGYYIALPFLYLVSVLPFPVLYLLSDLVYLLLYCLLGYRKQVVLNNLRNSFPEKTEAEIKKLCKAYYHYLCDVTLETFKTLTMSKKTLVRRVRFSDETVKLFDSLAEAKKSAILTMGHLGNWEWGGSAFSIICQQQLFVIYHPLTNKHYDKLVYHMRTRFGTGLIPMNNVFKDMLRNRNKTSVTAFITDQTPPPENAHWMTFLNQDTPVFKGTEVIARKLNYPILYATVRRAGRGYYDVDVIMLEENPKDTPDNFITEMHTKKLEKDIFVQPEVWIWSHRRWKHKRTKRA